MLMAWTTLSGPSSADFIRTMPSHMLDMLKQSIKNVYWTELTAVRSMKQVKLLSFVAAQTADGKINDDGKHAPVYPPKTLSM